MTTSNDQDKDIAGGLESAAGDLEVPEAVAERPAGGGTTPVTLKRGMTTDNSLYEWRRSVTGG